jgi:acetyl esterase/lipase
MRPDARPAPAEDRTDQELAREVYRLESGHARAVPEARGPHRLVSPVTHVGADAPPCLLLHGEEDEAVPIAQSRVFRDRILEAGGQAELTRFPGVGHAWFNHDPHFGPCLEHVRGFLVGHLGSVCDQGANPKGAVSGRDTLRHPGGTP